jgi:hypothetical protein
VKGREANGSGVLGFEGREREGVRNIVMRIRKRSLIIFAVVEGVLLRLVGLLAGGYVVRL